MARGKSWGEVVRSSYWREEDAREVIAAWERSGESLAAFCRAQGIAVGRLSRWVARLESSKSVAFHPVRVSEGKVGVGTPLIVELPGVATIRLPPGFAVEDLRRILSALEVEVEVEGC